MLHSPISTYVTICRKLSLQAWWSSRMLISSCLQIDKIMEPRNSMYNIFLKYTKETNHKSKRIYHFDWNIEDVLLMLEAHNPKYDGVRTPGHPLLIWSSYSQTKPVLVWNNILGVCSRRTNNFVRRISPVNWSSPAYKNNPLNNNLFHAKFCWMKHMCFQCITHIYRL